MADMPPDDPLTPWVERVAQGAERVQALAAGLNARYFT